jgi:ribosomal protein S8
VLKTKFFVEYTTDHVSLTATTVTEWLQKKINGSGKVKEVKKIEKGEKRIHREVTTMPY